MKGLLAKDFALFVQRKRTFIFLAVWAVVIAFSMDGSFMTGWMTIISSFFAISSLTYDEYDNCYPFLMSMPVTGKIYAIEKYLFGFLCGFGAWIFSVAVYLVVAAIKGQLATPGTEIIKLAVFIPVFMLLIDISLPLNLKFGSEKGRIAILLIWGVVFVGIFVLTKLFDVTIRIDETIFSELAIIGTVFLAAAVLTVISILLSIRIMQNKEF